MLLQYTRYTQYGCTEQLIASKCGRDPAAGNALSACCSDKDGSCADGNDDVTCMLIITPAPTPLPEKITVPTTIKGYNSTEFVSVPPGWSLSPLDAYRIAFAAKTLAPLGQVAIVDLQDVHLARRRLDGNGGNGGAEELQEEELPEDVNDTTEPDPALPLLLRLRRRLAAHTAENGISFDVEATAPSAAAALAIETLANATSGAAFLRYLPALPPSSTYSRLTPYSFSSHFST